MPLAAMVGCETMTPDGWVGAAGAGGGQRRVRAAEGGAVPHENRPLMKLKASHFLGLQHIGKPYRDVPQAEDQNVVL